MTSIPLGDTAPRYQHGFGNEYASEAVAGALPQGRNSPQRAPFDLYPELISGTAFTAPRDKNMQSWLYRIIPSVVHTPWSPVDGGPELVSDFSSATHATPNQLRWMPRAVADAPHDFLAGLSTMAGAGPGSNR